MMPCPKSCALGLSLFNPNCSQMFELLVGRLGSGPKCEGQRLT